LNPIGATCHEVTTSHEFSVGLLGNSELCIGLGVVTVQIGVKLLGQGSKRGLELVTCCEL
jgi:hypothetical protein